MTNSSLHSGPSFVPYLFICYQYCQKYPLLYLECQHICGSFLSINTTCTNIVFTIRNVVIHTAYSLPFILRISKSSLLYSMSSYILRIPRQHTFALSLFFCIFSRCRSAAGRLCLQYHHRHNQLHVLTFILRNNTFTLERITFNMSCYVLSCIISRPVQNLRIYSDVSVMLLHVSSHVQKISRL